MNIKKGDTVKIIAGKDRGKTGKVLKVFPENEKISVEGVNVYKKHTRPKRQGEKGEIIELVRPLNHTNAKILCPSCGKASRVGHKFENNEKIRYCKSCKAPL